MPPLPHDFRIAIPTGYHAAPLYAPLFARRIKNKKSTPEIAAHTANGLLKVRISKNTPANKKIIHA
jgi:hypothetical protein